MRGGGDGDGKDSVRHIFAAAELAELSAIQIMKGSDDLQDGRADTEEGRTILNLVRSIAGPALV